MDARGGVRNALLFNTLSYISDRLLTEGHTAAVLDEWTTSSSPPPSSN